MRIAVIGSGPSGLISAKHCLKSIRDLDFLHIYEKLSCLGGAWCPDKEHTILYDNLRTNLPKEIMEFEGLHYEDDNLSSFVTPAVVTRYLLKFAEMFQLKKYIKFQTKVIKVRRVNEEWELTAINLLTNEMITVQYDAVFVCNGHYSVPEIPHFNGLQEFKRNKADNVVIHSMEYRNSEVFKGLKVLIVGSGPSARDILIDIASAGIEVYISHHSEDMRSMQLPINIIHKPDIEKFTRSGVTFVDGTSCVIDRVLLATGFRYQLDFLDESCGVNVEEHSYVTPLYKQLFSIIHPTMVFIGLPFRTFIFPLLEIQAKCVVQVLNDKAKLPSSEEMHKERNLFEENNKLMQIPKRKYHNISSRVRQYVSELIELGNIEQLRQIVFEIFEDSLVLRRTEAHSYRQYKFIIKDNEHYEVKQIEEII